ncbi:HD domain-containing protein [Hoeflea sp. AS60]|uniref:HD domain-containing protein n=1 Tax=Hoeflea sp. AS60 TaxID=3135780 RepID=UPI00316D86BF
MTIDVLLLIALTEESEALSSSGFYSLSSPRVYQNFEYQSFDFLDASDVRRRGLFVSAGEVGSRIRDAATLFATKFKPKIVLNVGISGRLKDAKVGDVVVPSQLNIFDYRSAAQDEGDVGYSIQVGMKPALVSKDAQLLVNSITFRERNKLPTLEEYAAAHGVDLSEDEISQITKWRSSAILSTSPSIVVGPFAVSNMLIKSENFKRDVLQRSDRNYIAADMESAFIADGLKAIRDEPPFFAIRAISDPANSDKGKFDAVGEGIFRRWAMSNAVQTLKSLLEDRYTYGEVGSDLASAIKLENLDDDYLPNYPGQYIEDASDFDALDKRFANLRRRKKKDGDLQKGKELLVPFSEFVEVIRKSPKGGKFLLEGRSGSGKSAALKILELVLKSEFGDRCGVKFFNAQKLLLRAKRSSVRDEVKRIIDNLDFSDKALRYYFLVDELHGDQKEWEIFDHLEDFLSSKEICLVLSFGVEHFELSNILKDEPISPAIYRMEFAEIFEFKQVYRLDRVTFLELVEGLIKTGLPNSGASAENIVNEMGNLNFPYVNHFSISLFIDNYKRHAFNNVKNSTNFILRAMRMLCDEISKEKSDDYFEQICVEALRTNCKELAIAGYPKERESYLEEYRRKYATLPKMVQTALVANAIVYILSLYNKNGSDVFHNFNIIEEIFFSLVFSNDVNICVKDILENENIEDSVLNTAKKIIGDINYTGLAYSIYLAGRARSTKGRRKADEILEIAAMMLEDDKAESSALRIARRSLYISSALKGDRGATDKYIELLLSNPHEDSLNRGFHLEYYGDQLASMGITVALELEDKGGRWSSCRKILGDKINDALAKGNLNEYDRICIITYFSLVRYRLELGELNSQQRLAEREFAERLLASSLSVGQSINAYLNMLKIGLTNNQYSYLDAIVGLYVIKMLPRVGWVQREFGHNDNAVETVASHVFGAMLLADLLADKAKPDISVAERGELSRIILYHDLAEAYIGDYGPKDGETKAKENEAVLRIRAHAQFRNLKRLSDTYDIWDRFERGSDELSILAKDFDRLDAVLQASIYTGKFRDTEQRHEFLGYYIQLIQNATLREIAEEIFRRSELIAESVH